MQPISLPDASVTRGFGAAATAVAGEGRLLGLVAAMLVLSLGYFDVLGTCGYLTAPKSTPAAGLRESLEEVGLAGAGFAPHIDHALGVLAPHRGLEGASELVIAAGDKVLEGWRGRLGEIEEELPHGISRAGAASEDSVDRLGPGASPCSAARGAQPTNYT